VALYLADTKEPYAYLHYIFERLPSAQSTEDYEALPPQRLTPEQLAQAMSGA
jgi:hypothetical protein